MQRRTWAAIIVLGLTGLAGCRLREATAPATAATASRGDATVVDRVSAVLATSPTATRWRGRVERPQWIIERQHGDLVTVGLGDDRGTHWTRSRTVRIDLRRGTLEVLTTDAAGEEFWAPDR